MSARPLPMPINPALLKHADQRRQSLENRVADQITRFTGSMQFVYLHVIWFTAWIASGVEHYPFGLLTMIVSLEAIFLSTFVMISQTEDLLNLSNQILELTKAIHQMAAAQLATGRAESDST